MLGFWGLYSLCNIFFSSSSPLTYPSLSLFLFCLSLFFYFPFKNVKAILGSQATENKVPGHIWPEGYSLQTPGIYYYITSYVKY